MSLPAEISRSIDRAIDHLRRERSAGKPITDAETGDGLVFLGQWHDAYPTVLVRDPFLTDSAKIQWLYLAQEARRQPQGAIGMPSIQESARALHQARGTVIRDRLLLRVCRWISAVRPVRDPDTGRFLGHIYAMHGEPVQWHAAMEYDEHYVGLIERAQSHQDRRVQRAARANILGIREQHHRRRRPPGTHRPGGNAPHHGEGDRVRLGNRLAGATGRGPTGYRFWTR